MMKVRLPDALGNFKEKMQKAQENLESLEKKEYKGSSGGGAVEVTILGNLSVVDIKIKDEVFDDKEMLRDLLIASVNSAIKSAVDEKEEISSSLTSGFNLPGLM